MWCWGAFGEHCPFHQVVLWCTFFFLLLAWATCGGDHHYWIIFRHEARWPLRRFFIHFGPLSNFSRNHCVGPQLCLSIPNGRFPHRGAYEWTFLAFDHLLTQLIQVGLKVKVSKCRFWSPSRIFLSIEISHNYTLVTYGLRILGVSMGS